MRVVTEINDFEGKKVLVRVDWNVPVDQNGEVTGDSRIKASIPTIEYIKSHNGLPVVMSHFGRAGESLEKVIKFAKEKFPVLNEGVEFLENLRINKGEEENSEEFAHELASKGEIYVNDAFSNSHRAHASMVGVPKFLPSYAGIRFLEEFTKISECFSPEHPFLFILGGAKFETKLPLVEKFSDIADDIFIGGAMGTKAVEMGFGKNSKIMLPVGDIAALDASPETLDLLKLKIENSKFILWNGPLGKYEDGYTDGTIKLAKMLAESGAKVITGGGDTEAVIGDLGVADKFYFISLAGGAMLDFLANGTLPAIEALN